LGGQPLTARATVPAVRSAPRGITPRFTASSMTGRRAVDAEQDALVLLRTNAKQ
jgi:hypothetical protein